MNFQNEQRVKQIKWREGNISSSESGKQNKVEYQHIVPRKFWKETLWHGIQTSLPEYLKDSKIQAHSGTHNLLSSWINCANLYFITRIDAKFKHLMFKFLQSRISSDIVSLIDVELEFAFDDRLSPEKLLGEQNGSRGSGQTSPDVAFIIETKNGKGIILTESKYTEHSFYPCSARRTTDSDRKPGNPEPKRCMHPLSESDYKSICHQTVWGRKYWQHLILSKYADTILKRCPAATAGYQLLRQQALANGIANNGDYTLVVSSVAYDGRNKNLKNCMKSTGIKDFTQEWEKIFTGKTVFKTWTHQEWVDFVRQYGNNTLQKDWIKYINNRYGY